MTRSVISHGLSLQRIFRQSLRWAFRYFSRRSFKLGLWVYRLIAYASRRFFQFKCDFFETVKRVMNWSLRAIHDRRMRTSQRARPVPMRWRVQVKERGVPCGPPGLSVGPSASRP